MAEFREEMNGAGLDWRLWGSLACLYSMSVNDVSVYQDEVFSFFCSFTSLRFL